MSNGITTIGGQFFQFDDPESHQFDINEIAHALSHSCRYTGHVPKFYSVAQHCVLVSSVLPAKLALEGLLHDASEAYMADIASPLKAMLPDYKLIEKRVELAIAKHFGLPEVQTPEVKIADTRMLMTEKESFKLIGSNWPPFDPYDFTIVPWDAQTARQMFLEAYWDLTKGGF